MHHENITINTTRLTIRPMRESDAATVRKYRNQPEVSLFQGWTPQDDAEVIAHAKAMAQREFASADFWWQMVIVPVNPQANKPKLIGDIAFSIEPEKQAQAELGIALDTRWQKQGFATEAVKALVDWLFQHKKLHRIHVSIDPANAASIALFERCGFRHEGLLKKAVWFKQAWCDDLIMAVLAEEWNP